MDPHIDDRIVAEDVVLSFQDVATFGSNPGNLRMRRLASSSGAEARPMVIALHGCTQTAEGFALGSGWARLAVEHDFALLLPEQRSANNSRQCFSWFEPGDIRRGEGEVASIRQMIDTMVGDRGADPKRIFVTGLSAGGAMACALLATYPELFAGGAIVAGLPYKGASGMSEAFESMFTGKVKEPRIWGDLVRRASTHTGPWPNIAIWQGSADTTVKPINAGELVKQWTDVHGIGAQVPQQDKIGTITRRAWSEGGTSRIIEYSVPGLGHAVPTDGQDAPAPFFIPGALSCSEQICRDWGLILETTPRTLRGRLGVG